MVKTWDEVWAFVKNGGCVCDQCGSLLAPNFPHEYVIQNPDTLMTVSEFVSSEMDNVSCQKCGRLKFISKRYLKNQNQFSCIKNHVSIPE